MREIGISPRFSRDKFVPLQTKQRYSTMDISGKVFLTLFFRGFVPFLSLADFWSRDKNLQVVDLQRLKSCFGELVTATTSNHQKCTRKRFLQLRSESEGINKDQLVDRILGQRIPGEKVIVYTVSGTDAKIDNEVEVPKYNHLDKE